MNPTHHPLSLTAAPTKYGNHRTERAGQPFDSMREADRYQDLLLHQRAGLIAGEIERQVRFPLRVDGTKVATYVADFVYTNRDGELVVEDCKGFRTPVYKLKARLFAALYGQPILET